MSRRDDADLEPLPVDDLAPAPPSPFTRFRLHWSRRRWLLVVGGAAASIVVVAGPVRILLDRSTVDRAASSYAAYRGYEAARQERTAPLRAALVPDDQATVDAAISSLDREEARRLRAMAGGLRVPIVVDPTSWTLARTMADALRTRATELDSLSTWRLSPPTTRGAEPPDASAGVTRRMDHAAALLGRQLAATGRRMPSSQPRPLRAADSTIASLRGWTDRPTHSTLAASDGRSVIRLDVDKASVVGSDFEVRQGFVPSGPGFVIGRAGWVAALVGSGVAAFPDADVPRLLPIDRVDDAFAADRPDAIWVVSAKATTVTEIDQHGTPVSPAWTIPPGTVLNPATITGGFVLSRADGGALEAWTPADGRRQPISPGGALLLAARGHLVLWQPARTTADGRAPVHLTDLSTGADTILRTALDVQMPQDRVATTCSFSPDGRSVACSVLTRGQAGFPGDSYQLGIIDIAARTLTVVPGAASYAALQPTPLWTSDGQRVFFVTYAQGSPYLATWARGDARATELRYHPGAWISLTVIPS